MATHSRLVSLLLIEGFVLGLGHFAHAYAASDGLTLNGAITEAREHSPEALRAQAAYDENRWKKTEALGAGFLPRVSISANHYFDEKYVYTDLAFGGSMVSVPGIFPSSQLEFDASIPVFDGLASVNRYRAASMIEEASRNELERTSFRLEEDVKQAFYDALSAALLDEVAEQNVKTLEDHLHQAEVLKRGGSATSYDLLRVQVQLTEAKSDALDAKDNVTLTRRKLTQVLGLEGDNRPLEGELPIPRSERVQGIALGDASTSRSDLRALSLRADAADRFSGAQSSWMVPSLSLGAQYTMYNDLTQSMTDTANYRSAYSLGIFVRWNLFDGGVALAQSKEAEYRKVQADRTSEEAKLEVPYDFDLWKRRYLSNASRFEAKNLDVQRSEEAVRLARDEEKAGTRTSTEVLDAEFDLFRSKAGVVNSQNNAAQALIHLELALGRKIDI